MMTRKWPSEIKSLLVVVMVVVVVVVVVGGGGGGGGGSDLVAFVIHRDTSTIIIVGTGKQE